MPNQRRLSRLSGGEQTAPRSSLLSQFRSNSLRSIPEAPEFGPGHASQNVERRRHSARGSLMTSAYDWEQLLSLPRPPFANNSDSQLFEFPSALESRDTFFSAPSEHESRAEADGSRSIHSASAHDEHNDGADSSGADNNGVAGAAQRGSPERESEAAQGADSPTIPAAPPSYSSEDVQEKTSAPNDNVGLDGGSERKGTGASAEAQSSTGKEKISATAAAEEMGEPQSMGISELVEIAFQNRGEDERMSEHGESPRMPASAADSSVAVGIVTQMPQEQEQQEQHEEAIVPQAAGRAESSSSSTSTSTSSHQPPKPKPPAWQRALQGMRSSMAKRSKPKASPVAPSPGAHSGAAEAAGEAAIRDVPAPHNSGCVRCSTTSRADRWFRALSLLGAVAVQVLAYAGLSQGLTMDRGISASLGFEMPRAGGGGNSTSPSPPPPVTAPGGAPAPPEWWFTAAYALGAGAAALPAARLGAVLGRHRALALGWLWFAAWSLVAGFAWMVNSSRTPSSPASADAGGGHQPGSSAANPTNTTRNAAYIFFVVCRALQGAGPGFLAPNALAMLGRAYSDGCGACCSVGEADGALARLVGTWRRGLPLAAFGTAAPLGFVGGGVLFALCDGGAVWQWGFYILAAVCFLFSLPSLIVLQARSRGKSYYWSPYGPDAEGQPSATTPQSSRAADPESQQQSGRPDDGAVGNIDESEKTSHGSASSPSVWTSLDGPGTLLGVASLLSMGFAVTQGPVAGWSTPYVYFILIIGGLLGAAFVWHKLFMRKLAAIGRGGRAPVADTAIFIHVVDERPVVTATAPVLADERGTMQSNPSNSEKTSSRGASPFLGTRMIAALGLATGALTWGSVGVWIYTASRALQVAHRLPPLVATLSLMPAVGAGIISTILCSWTLGNARLVEEKGAARGSFGEGGRLACLPLLASAACAASGLALSAVAQKKEWVLALLGAAFVGVGMGISFPAVTGSMLLLLTRPPRAESMGAIADAPIVAVAIASRNRGVGSISAAVVTTMQYSMCIAMGLAATAETYAGMNGARPRGPLLGLTVAQYLGCGFACCGVAVAALYVVVVSIRQARRVQK